MSEIAQLFGARAGAYASFRPDYPAALFDWLQGRATAAAGWQVDLSRMEQGRLSARRHDPQPPAALRIVLDTP